MLKTAFDVMLAAVSPWQSRVDGESTRRFDSVVLHPNVDFLEGSQTNPLLVVARLVMDEKQGCSLEDDQVCRITGIDPDLFNSAACWDSLPESMRYEALGRLAERMLRSWRNQIRESVILPGLGSCDAFEIVAE